MDSTSEAGRWQHCTPHLNKPSLNKPPTPLPCCPFWQPTLNVAPSCPSLKTTWKAAEKKQRRRFTQTGHSGGASRRQQTSVFIREGEDETEPCSRVGRQVVGENIGEERLYLYRCEEGRHTPLRLESIDSKTAHPPGGFRRQSLALISWTSDQSSE